MLYRLDSAERCDIFLMTMKCVKLERPDVIQQLRDDYLRTLVAPMDGMWEGVSITYATFFEIQDREQRVGYFCLDPNNYLLRFHLLENYRSQAQEIFGWIVSTYGIQYAFTSTIEPLYFALCLDVQKTITPQSYLFRDNKRIDLPSDASNSSFRKVEKHELDDVARFYQANTEGSGEWIEAFVKERLSREELFGLYDGETLITVGECIPSRTQIPYADLGMIVAQAYRGRGLASSMLIQLKKYCYDAGWKPICSCAVDNYASKKAIEKAGFSSEQRMVKILFSSDELSKFPFKVE
jgi:RimJ/RimL family protein N-acetyltransferase